jgi:hypothetical protein
MPDGSIRGINQKGRIVIGDTQFPYTILTKWPLPDLNEMDIFAFVDDVVVDSKFYVIDSYNDVLSNGVIVRTPVLSDRYTGPELKTIIVSRLKNNLRSSLRRARQEIDYLVEFEPSNDTSNDEWVEYIVQLKLAAQNIKSEVQAIQSYDEGVEFFTTYETMLPERPEE